MSVPIVRRSLWHDKSKLTLHIVGIAASLMLITLLVGFREGMYASLTAYIDHAGADLVVSQIGSRGLFYANSGLPATLHQDIETVPGTTEIDHVVVGDTIFTHANIKLPVLVIGYNPETGFGGPWNIGSGRTLQGDDEILLDSWLAWRSGVAVGDRVNVLGSEFTVVGLTRETASWMSPYIFMPLASAEDVLQLSGDASFFLLRLSPSANRDVVAETITTAFSDTAVFTPDEMAATDRKFMATILDRPIGVMLIISAVIAIAVTGLIIYTSIINRLAEFSTLKAIGSSNNWLRWLVVRETLSRALLGFVLSLALSYLAAELIEYVWPQFTVTIRPEIIPVIGLAALIMTLVSALWPIQQIANVDPSVVFRA
ncbi:MAG: ABC transporter permease [Anaerolineae bacterium]|nr:ABC transporter permease [Anaerolineae bacterium]